jgi:formyl-CoA transferase
MVRDVTEAASLPALEERRLKIGLRIPGLPEREQVEIVNAGFLFSEDSPGVDATPPRIGEHSEEIFQSLGFDAAEIRVLRANE